MASCDDEERRHRELLREIRYSGPNAGDRIMGELFGSILAILFGLVLLGAILQMTVIPMLKPIVEFYQRGPVLASIVIVPAAIGGALLVFFLRRYIGLALRFIRDPWFWKR